MKSEELVKGMHLSMIDIFSELYLWQRKITLIQHAWGNELLKFAELVKGIHLSMNKMKV